jgi:hypothetical protein
MYLVFFCQPYILLVRNLPYSKLLNILEHIFFRIQLSTKKLKSNGGRRQQTCAICGRPIKTSIIRQKVGTDSYVVDKDECAVILKRLHSVYGNDFCMLLKEKNIR